VPGAAVERNLPWRRRLASPEGNRARNTILPSQSRGGTVWDLAPIDLRTVERKIFWVTFALLGLVADFVLPFWWALGATIPIFLVSWWVAYRSDWF
jgi:hypothetical protein